MNNEEEIRKIIRSELEIFINAHHWPDEQLRMALLDVAKNHLWKQGFMVRLRYWANVIGFLGIIGGAIAMIISVLGFDVVRK